MARKINVNNIYIVVFVLVVVLLFLIFFRNSKVDERFLDVTFSVDNKLGMKINTSSLDFGIVPAGAAITKKVVLDNGFEFPVKVKVFVDKEIEDYVFSENDFIILSGESKKVEFVLSLPQDTVKGEYSGKIKMSFYKA